MRSSAPLSYQDLRNGGLTRRQIDRAVRSGELIRVRRGRYLASDARPEVIRAARLGGQPDCVTLLAMMGVFVQDSRAFHIAVPPAASRLGPRAHRVVRHWRDDDHDIISVLAQACRCQTVSAAIATLDSAWHLGVVDEAGIADVIARLPARFAVLRAHLDPRAEAGTETLVRLMLRRLGCDVVPQVVVHGVGRVDLVVDGWLIVECDSKAYHSDWNAQRRDYRRNIAAARLGYIVLRFTAEDILFVPDDVFDALRCVVRGGRVHNSSRQARTRRQPTG